MRNRLLPLVLLLCLPGCDSADNPAAPSGSSLAVSANPTKISLTGSSVITITGFRPDGNPLSPGTQIRLSVDMAGRIETPIVEVGAGGTATGKLLAVGTVGTATVSASLTSGGGEAATTAVEVSEFKPTVALSANPTVIGTGEVSEITVISRDENQFPFAAEVELIASLGTLRVDGREVSSIKTAASNGRGVVNFWAGDQTGDGSVTAFIDNSDLTEPLGITIETEPTLLTITPDRVPILAAGNQSFTFTARLTDADGRGVRQRLIEFVTTFETNEGQLNVASDFTNNDGEVVTTLTTNMVTLSGEYRVTATSGDLEPAVAKLTVGTGGGGGGT